MRPQFGSISSGTMRLEDLIPTFADELNRLDAQSAHHTLISCAHRWCEEDEENPDHASDGDELLTELFDALNEFAPDYGYFGAHPGDGADYGFWLHQDWQQMARDDGVLEVSDTSEVPEDYQGLVLHVNDHGNATLYRTGRPPLEEIWSVV